MTDEERAYYMKRREALLLELGATEDLLCMERTRVAKRKQALLEQIVKENLREIWPDLV